IMINIPYDFNGDFEYQSYDEIVERIKGFEKYHIFGQDASGDYDMYAIELGNPGKPVIMLHAGIHGSEWQPTQYTFYFMEQLRDNTFPDTNFRDFLLNNFCVVFIPLVNPYGTDHVIDHMDGIYLSYYNDPDAPNIRSNYNGQDLNKDYFEFTQPESQNVKDLIDKYKPFSVVDMHMYQPDYGVSYGRNSVVANGMQPSKDYRDDTEPYVVDWKESLENYIGEEITRWTNVLGDNSSLARVYFARTENPWTPHTLGYITEIVRPAYRPRDGEKTLVRPLTDKQIYKYGMAHVYLFLKTSVQYYVENFKTQEYDNKLMYVRDLKGNEYHLQATVTHDLELNGNQSLSFTVLPTKANRRFIGDLSEMWEVIDGKGVVHRIVYCKQKGRGNLKYDYTPEQKESFLSPVQTTKAI